MDIDVSATVAEVCRCSPVELVSSYLLAVLLVNFHTTGQTLRCARY